MGMAIGSGLRLALWGFVVGIPLAIAAKTAVGSLLFGVGTFDSYAIVGACLVLAATAVVAAFIPARRAARIEPVRALQGE
jgi:ABC-type antimicrobial peptide transport system permease subunit